MRLSPLGIAAIREQARRHPAPVTIGKTRCAKAAAEIREWMYPKQRAFFTSRATWRATVKTRRAGATSGGVRELIARALEFPGFRATYVTDTGVNARDRAWNNDNKSGFCDIVRQLGEPVRLARKKLEAYSIGGIVIEVRNGEMQLDFDNGSQIDLFGANDIGRQQNKRGSSKDVFWIDEAQDFNQLEAFIGVISPSMTDFQGECWVTGTPGRDCLGLFYEITKEREEGDEPLAEWEVHHFTVADNPFFGAVVETTAPGGAIVYYVEDNLAHNVKLSKAERAEHRYGPYDTSADAELAASDIRWEVTAGREKRTKNLKGDEPDFVREWLGKWVKADARYVYPVHAVPKHQLLFAPQRLADNPFVGTDPRFDGHPPWYDHQLAIRDLPRVGRDGRPHKWLYSLWFDFGFNPDPFAAVLWAFTPSLNDVYEMFSWKQTGIHADDQARYMKLLWDVEPAIVSFGGDSAGKDADFAEWERRLNLPLEKANKPGKNTLEELLAGDIRRGLVHLREGSPLYSEMRNLVYLPTKPGKTREVHKHRVVNGIVHGDHCCDAARYGFSALTHYLSQVAGDKPKPGSREALQAEERKIERSIEQADAIRERKLEEADEFIDENRQYEDGGYQWE